MSKIHNNMKRLVPLLIACLLLSYNLSGIDSQANATKDSVAINDGPYIFLVNDTLKPLRADRSFIQGKVFDNVNVIVSTLIYFY